MEPTGPVDQTTEQPPSAESIAPEAGAASEKRSGWDLRGFIAQRFGQRAPDAPSPDEQAEGEQSETPADEWKPPTFASKEEYDRWLESERRSYADRRDHDRQRRAAADEAAKLNEQVAALEAKKAEALAADDLWEVGQVESQIAKLKAGVEEGKQADQVLTEIRQAVAGETVAKFDGILDSWVLDEPKSERAKFFPSDEEAKNLAPWEQRQYVADRVKAARDARVEEATKAKLRKDPVFRKEVIAEWRGTDEAATSEPVLVSSAPGEASTTNDMTNWIRQRARAVR